MSDDKGGNDFRTKIRRSIDNVSSASYYCRVVPWTERLADRYAFRRAALASEMEQARARL